MPAATSVSLTAAPSLPKTKILDHSLPAAWTSETCDWRDYRSFTLIATPLSGLRQLPEIPYEIVWREHNPAPRDSQSLSKPYELQTEWDRALAVPGAAREAGIVQWGDLRSPAPIIAVTLLSSQEIAATPVLGSFGSYRLPGFGVDAIAAHPAPLSEALYRFDAVSPQPPLRDTVAPTENLPARRHISPGFLANRFTHALSLPANPDWTLQVKPDSDPAAAVPLAWIASTRQNTSALPEGDVRVWPSAGSSNFQQFPNGAMRPDAVGISTEWKEVSYSLKTPPAPIFNESPKSGLREHLEGALSAIPDLIPHPESLPRTGEPARSKTLPETDVRVWPSAGSSNFQPFPNGAMRPDAVGISTGWKEVFYSPQTPPAPIFNEPPRAGFREHLEGALSAIPDLIPHPESLPKAGEHARSKALPETDVRVWPSAGSSNFQQFPNGAMRPDAVGVPTEWKEVLYSPQTPPAPSFNEPPRSGLREHSEGALSAVPDLIPQPESLPKAGEYARSKALPETDVRVWLSAGSSNFQQFPNGVARPRPIRIPANWKDVPHQPQTPASPVVFDEPPTSRGIQAHLHSAFSAVPDLIPAAEARVQSRKPLMKESGLPDFEAHAEPPVESNARFSRTQRLLAQPPLVTQPPDFRFSSPASLPQSTAQIGGVALRPEQQGRFSAMQARTAQIPAECTHLAFARPTALATGIPAIAVKPAEAGMAQLAVPQRPEIRESNSVPAAIPAGEPATLALSLDVALNAQTPVFARRDPETAVPAAFRAALTAPAAEIWGSLSNPARGDAGMPPARQLAPHPTDFASLPQPYDRSTADSAEVLRERIFSPILKSHFTMGKLTLSARRPALRPMRTTAALDFRFRRTKTVWDRAAKWKRGVSLRILPVSLTPAPPSGPARFESGPTPGPRGNPLRNRRGSVQETEPRV